MQSKIKIFICFILAIMLLAASACSTSTKGVDNSGESVYDDSGSESVYDDSDSESQQSDQDSKVFKITQLKNGATIDLSPNEFIPYLNKQTEGDIAKWLYEHKDDAKALYAQSRTTSFYWRSNIKGASPYTVIISDEEDFSVEKYSFTTTETSYTIRDIKPGTYYYKIKDSLGNETSADAFTIKNYVRSFGSSMTSVYNMRDLGGWKTEDGKTIKYGLSYRSGELNAESGNFLTEVLGLKYEIDLRKNSSGKNYSVSVVPSSFNINFLQAGIKQGDYVLQDKTYYNFYTPEQIAEKRHEYAPWEDGFATALYNAFKLYTDESNYPILFHCTSGADRTGTFAFLLEGMLGVEVDDLYRDFELTSITMSGQRWRSNIKMDANKNYYFTDGGYVPRDGNYIAIGILYKGLMECYSTGDGKLSSAIKNYLKKDIGLTDEDIQAIKDIMLE